MMSRNKARKEQEEAARSSESCCCNPQKASAMMAGCCGETGWDCGSMMQVMMKACARQEDQDEAEESAEHPA